MTDMTRRSLVGLGMALPLLGRSRVWPSWPNWVRVSVGDKQDMLRFRQAFAEVTAG